MEETGVPLTAFRVEDPEFRPPPRRTEPVAGDGHLRPLPHDVPPQTDPRAARQLEAHPGRLGDDMGHRGAEVRWLEDHEECLGAPGEGDQSMEAILERRATDARVQSWRQVDDQQVHRPGREEGTGQGQAIGQCPGREDHQPLQSDPASDRLDRIERSGKVQPRHDGARGLDFRGQPQGESGPAAGSIAPHGHARGSWQAAGPEDGIERREPGRDDVPCRADITCRDGVPCRADVTRRSGHLRGDLPGRGSGCRPRHGGRPGGGRVRLIRERHGGQRSHRLPEPTRRGRSPASLEGRQRGRHVGGSDAHRSADYRTDVLVWQAESLRAIPNGGDPARQAPGDSSARSAGGSNDAGQPACTDGHGWADHIMSCMHRPNGWQEWRFQSRPRSQDTTVWQETRAGPGPEPHGARHPGVMRPV